MRYVNARVGAFAFAERLAALCSDVLGDALVSAILHGSLTLGGFTPGRSDIDLLVVVEDRLGDSRLAALTEAVDQVSADAPSRVDLRLVTRAAAGTPAPAPVLEAGFALSPGHETQVEARVAEEPDLAVEFSIARAHGRRLAGAAPGTVIGPVPKAWLVEIGDRQLAAWQGLTGDADHAELMVLTTCRIWRFAAEARYCSKTAAGEWALAREPSLTAVGEALRQRNIDPTAPINEEGIARLLALARRELRKART